MPPFPLNSATGRFGRRGWRALALVIAVHAAKPDRAVGQTSPAIELDRVTVLGSRLRQAAGPDASPALIYDRDFIEATGVFRLADFLALLPQNYAGAGSGRGSAPNDANPDFGVRSESSLPLFSFALGLAAVPLGQSGVSGANLRGLGSGSTLVLVDGRRRPIAAQGNRSTDTRQGFVELNTIPLGMIERIEVLPDGASALYGSDAIGGVINVVLKKNYAGAELATSYRGTFEGGARERGATLSGGFTSSDARLRGTVSVELYDRAALRADQRPFSAGQDHREVVVGVDADGTPIPGHDLRLNWGYPAVVQARTGTLAGVVGPDGAPVSLALVPAGAAATPQPAQFTGVAATSPNGLLRTSTARFLMLVAPQESRSAGTSFEYDLGGGTLLYAGFTHSDVRGRFDAQPPVSNTSATTGFGSVATLVPATIAGQPNEMNPFGQDVMVGLVHEEFGPTNQTTRTRHRGAFAGATGLLDERWTWDAGVSWAQDRFGQRNRTLDAARFAAALAAPDPARRFNPFIDARAGGATNAHVYPALVAVDAYDGRSTLAVASLIVDGPLLRAPGGEVQFAAGAELAESRHHAITRPDTGAATEARAERRSYAGFAEFSVPLVGPANAAPLLRHLSLQLAGRHEQHGRAGHSTDPRIGAVWSPAKGLNLRASHSLGFRVPSLTEYETTDRVSTSTVTDPRRQPASTPGVTVRAGSHPDAAAETSTHQRYGATLMPGWLPGLSLDVDFHRTRQRDALQVISTQTIVNNESVFAGRITRAAATPDDVAANQPGAITAVDARFVNFGEIKNDSLDFGVNYDLPWRAMGRFRVVLNGTQTLAAGSILRPGTPVDLEGDTAAPPRWRWNAWVTWRHRKWNAALFLHHLGGFQSNSAGNLTSPRGAAAMTTVDVTVGRTFADGLWRDVGRGAKITVGIGNVFDRPPPFANTVFGYNGGLHSALGRTYSVSLLFPF